MNFLFSPYFENISRYYSPCNILSRNSYGKSDYFSCDFLIRLAAITQFKNDDNRTNVATLLCIWRRVRVCKIISSILSCSICGRRSVVEDYGKESISGLEISIHSSLTSGYVYFKWKSFLCMHWKDFNPVGHPAVCSVHFTAECFTQAFYEKGTRKYLKPGSVPAVRKKKTSIISERPRRMVGEYLFAVCANITCTVRYIFPHIPKRYFARLSCACTNV